jgi:hypothetical protein
LNICLPFVYCRHRERSLVQLQQALAAINASPLLPAAGQAPLPAPPTPAGADLQAAVVGGKLCLEAVERHLREQAAAAGQDAAQQPQQQQQLEHLQAAVGSLAEAVAGVRAPFEWADGPLVQVGACLACLHISCLPAWLCLCETTAAGSLAFLHGHAPIFKIPPADQAPRAPADMACRP